MQFLVDWQQCCSTFSYRAGGILPPHHQSFQSALLVAIGGEVGVGALRFFIEIVALALDWLRAFAAATNQFTRRKQRGRDSRCLLHMPLGLGHSHSPSAPFSQHKSSTLCDGQIKCPAIYCLQMQRKLQNMLPFAAFGGSSNCTAATCN